MKLTRSFWLIDEDEWEQRKGRKRAEGQSELENATIPTIVDEWWVKDKERKHAQGSNFIERKKKKIDIAGSMLKKLNTTDMLLGWHYKLFRFIQKHFDKLSRMCTNWWYFMMIMICQKRNQKNTKTAIKIKERERWSYQNEWKGENMGDFPPVDSS